MNKQTDKGEINKGEVMDTAQCYADNEVEVGVKPKNSSYERLLRQGDGVYVYCSKQDPNPKWEKALISLN